MNILFFSELFYPHGSGGELATRLYADLLCREGFKIVVVTNRFAGETEVSKSHNFRIYRVPLSGNGRVSKYSVLRSLDVLCSTLVRKMLRWADVVYVPKFWYTTIPLAKMYGKPVIAHLHGFYPICPVSVLYDFSKGQVCQHRSNWIRSPSCVFSYERSKNRSYKELLASLVLNSTLGFQMGKLVTLSDSIVCVSSAQKQIVQDRMPSLASKLSVVYNPVPEVAEFDQQVGDFAYFGGSSLVKGFNVLCAAMRAVNPKISIHTAGMRNLSKDLYRQLKELGMIVHHRLSREQLFSGLYKRIQVVIVPSVSPESWSYVVSEALVGKRIVIASRVGGIPEQAEGLDGAFLFQPGSSEQLASLIMHVRSLPESVKLELGHKNRELFLRRFNNNKSLQGFITVLEKISRL